MARSTGKKKSSKSPTTSTPTTPPTTPATASDTPNSALAPAPAPSSTLSQETSAPANASASEKARKTRPDNNPKIKIKISTQARNALGATTLPATNPDNAALLARLAEKEAEIDRLRKTSMALPTNPKEIMRPHGSIANLQKAMGLENDRPLYMNCRATVSDVLLHAGIPLGVDWRRQDPLALGKVANVAKSRSNQLQLYEKNWAALEIMKTIIKNKRSYRTKIGRINTFSTRESDSVDQETDNSGSQPTASTSTIRYDKANNVNEEDNGNFSNSDEDEDSDVEDPEESASSAGPAGTKRKATESVGKGKKRKV